MKKIHAVCMLHFISGAVSVLTGFEHKITSNADVTDRLVKFYGRTTAPKLWSQIWVTFTGQQIDLCENVYNSFGNKNNEVKPKFTICPEDESSDSNEYIHAWDDENRHSFSVNVLCCVASEGGQDVLKYYLSEAENECVFVFLEVENESNSSADEKFNEETGETVDACNKSRRNDNDDDESNSDERETENPVDRGPVHKLNNDVDNDDNGTHDEREKQTPVESGTTDFGDKLIKSNEDKTVEEGKEESIVKEETSDYDGEEVHSTTYRYRLGPHLSKLKNDFINNTERTNEVTIDLRYEVCPQDSEETADARVKSPQNDDDLLTRVKRWVESAFRLRTHDD